MSKFRFIAAAGVFALAAGCSDIPTEAVAPKVHHAVFECDLTRDCGLSAVEMDSDTVPMNTDRLFAFVINGLVYDVAQITPSTRLTLAGVVGPTSDTVPPAPLVSGAIRSIYARMGGQQFADVLARVGLTGPAPSDTVPGPGPQANLKIADFNSDGVQDLLVFASAKYLSNRKIISAGTTHFILSIVDGENSLAFPAVPVTITNVPKEEIL